MQLLGWSVIALICSLTLGRSNEDFRKNMAEEQSQISSLKDTSMLILFLMESPLNKWSVVILTLF